MEAGLLHTLRWLTDVRFVCGVRTPEAAGQQEKEDPAAPCLHDGFACSHTKLQIYWQDTKPYSCTIYLKGMSLWKMYGYV